MMVCLTLLIVRGFWAITVPTFKKHRYTLDDANSHYMICGIFLDERGFLSNMPGSMECKT